MVYFIILYLMTRTQNFLFTDVVAAVENLKLEQSECPGKCLRKIPDPNKD